MIIKPWDVLDWNGKLVLRFHRANDAYRYAEHLESAGIKCEWYFSGFNGPRVEVINAEDKAAAIAL